MHRMRAADGRRSRLGQAEVSNLPRLDELRHSSDGLFDRRLRIDAVLIIEIDRIDAEPLERRVAGAAPVLGAPVDAEKLAVFGSHVSEFRGEADFAASIANGAANEPLVGEGAVDV